MSRCITTGRAGLLALLLLLPAEASAQISGQGIQAANQGVFLGHAGTVNCGANLLCTLNAGIETITASGVPAGTVTGSGTTNVFTIWTNGPGSVLGDSVFQQNTSAIVKKGSTAAVGGIGFNNAGNVEVIADGSTVVNAGLFNGAKSDFTIHDSTNENNNQFLMYNDSEGMQSGVVTSIYGTYPSNIWQLNFGNAAGGVATGLTQFAVNFASVALGPSVVGFASTNFQFSAPGSTLISSPSGGFVYFDVSGGVSVPSGRSHTFLIADVAIPESTIAGASILGIFQQDGTTSLTQFGSANNAGTAVAGIKGEIIGNAASSTKAVTTLEVQDATGDVSLNLFSPTNNSIATGIGTLSLNTTQTGAGTAPYMFFPKPGGGAGLAIHAADTYVSTVFLTWPNVFPASNGQALVATTAGVMSWASVGTGTVTSIATTSPIAGGTITTTGTISCPTCITSAVTSATGTANQITVSASTGAVTWSLPSAVTMPGSLTVTTRTGTPATMAVFTSGGVLAETTLPTSGVTSIATTSPITGGTITTTGTIACATCVTSAASLTSNAIVLGAGSQATSALGSLGTTTTVLHGNAAGAPTFGAVVLTTDVSGVLPVANGGAATAITWTNCFMGATRCDVANSSEVINSLTTRKVWLFELPYAMTVNQFSTIFGSAATPGTMKMCVYTADGATKSIDITITPVASSVVSGAVSAVAITPGLYYFVAGCATTCNVQLNAGFAMSVLLTTSTPSGKTPWVGTVSHTSGTCNTTLGTVTSAGNNTPVFRLDN